MLSVRHVSGHYTCTYTVSGAKIKVSLTDLAHDLAAKADSLAAHLRSQEWITDRAGFGWFNGYYDNDGRRVEGDGPNGARMTLTGQVFTLMGGIATDAQAREIVRAANRYLYDRRLGGYRLNTDFGDMQLGGSTSLTTGLGRCFGFAFGHKENGAMFSRMAVMYVNTLYRRGLARKGFKVLDEIYLRCHWCICAMKPPLAGLDYRAAADYADSTLPPVRLPAAQDAS